MQTYQTPEEMREEFLRFYMKMPYAEKSEYPDIEIANWWLCKLQAREEWLVKSIEAMKPILYHEDANRHLENVARYNTLNDVLLLLTPKN